MKEFIDSVKALGEKMTGKEIEGTELVDVVDEMADKYEIEQALRGIAEDFDAKRVVLQGETYGLAVQGNPYKLNERRFAAPLKPPTAAP